MQTLIRQGRVQVNGSAGRPSQRLRPGDQVRIEIPDRAVAAPLEPEARPLDIVYEDASLIVLDKPAGLVVHPGAGIRRGTLAHALLHHAPEIAAVGGAGRPGIVHRLDRDTSGLMVVAKTEQAHRALVEAIQERRVHRTYLALVWGVPRSAMGSIDTSFGRHPRDRKRMAVLTHGGKPARTHWRILERLGLASVLEVRLETGRTHQIRVHLEHIGHPVVGDPVYGGRGKKQLSLGPGQRSLAEALLECLDRQALHAVRLEFTHPVNGNSLSFTRAAPEDFARALDLLRSQT